MHGTPYLVYKIANELSDNVINVIIILIHKMQGSPMISIIFWLYIDAKFSVSIHSSIWTSWYKYTNTCYGIGFFRNGIRLVWWDVYWSFFYWINSRYIIIWARKIPETDQITTLVDDVTLFLIDHKHV